MNKADLMQLTEDEIIEPGVIRHPNRTSRKVKRLKNTKSRKRWRRAKSIASAVALAAKQQAHNE